VFINGFKDFSPDHCGGLDWQGREIMKHGYYNLMKNDKCLMSNKYQIPNYLFFIGHWKFI
jgi:hypothetical protein